MKAENSINNQIKKEKKGVFWSQAEDYNRGDLLEVKARSHTFSRQRIIHQNDILLFYIKFTKDTQSG